MKHKLNNNGLSSILFAMIFTIILSLLAVGFATLVRNDQRQTLDQSLGYQAQYAAETAINQTYEYLRTTPTALSEKSDCSSAPSTNYEIVAGTGVKVTCITWKASVEDIIIKPLAVNNMYSTRFVVNQPYNTLRIKWTSVNQNTYAVGTRVLPDPILSNRYSILRLTLLRTGSTTPLQYYLVPANSSQNGDLMTDPSGTVVLSSCSGGECTANISNSPINPGGFYDGFVSLMAMGQDAASVSISAQNGGGVKRGIMKSQFAIDATAVAADVTRRVEARMPVLPQTWRPWFAGSAGIMCKDIKIDGTNNTSVSGAALCPN